MVRLDGRVTDGRAIWMAIGATNTITNTKPLVNMRKLALNSRRRTFPSGPVYVIEIKTLVKSGYFVYNPE